jgi:2-keto-4-pentenoate hydratase/2-oxohepta-3-ene-1,7-dioic acid hydratase in catechol pathway
MRLATFSHRDAARVGIVVGEGIIDLARQAAALPREMSELITRWSEFQPQLTALEHRPPDLPLVSVLLHAPVPKPRSIFAIGLNYADHIAESGLEKPSHQTWFSKAVTAVSGPFDAIELPVVSEQLDYECELVLVIGKRCRNVPRERAQEVIFGYCAGNDVSVRDWQLRTGQWMIGKSFDTHAPTGPWITTADAIDPHRLDIRCLVNGQERQKSNTRNLVFDCFAQIEHLTRAITLEPGDLLFTGTCGGVAAAHKPPLWLKAGDVVRVEISSLGAIENRVEAAKAAVMIG